MADLGITAILSMIQVRFSVFDPVFGPGSLLAVVVRLAS
jgi:hypothetical protein